jgi:hypothetical protein
MPALLVARAAGASWFLIAAVMLRNAFVGLISVATAGLATSACRPRPVAHDAAPPKISRSALCSDVATSGSPVFHEDVRAMQIAFGAPHGLASALSNIRTIHTMGLSSGGAASDEMADTQDAHPLPCLFTMVFIDRTCPLEATGRRSARRQVVTQLGGPPTPSEWRLEVEVVDRDGCVKKAVAASAERDDEDGFSSTIVEGLRPDLRVAQFEMIVSYAGGDGSHGPLTDASGTDLRPEIARWPKDEQVLYAHGPGFEALRTHSGDLFWFTSLSSVNSPWQTRLRAGDGRLLRLPHGTDEKQLGADQRVLLLREGSHLYWRDGQIR